MLIYFIFAFLALIAIRSAWQLIQYWRLWSAGQMSQGIVIGMKPMIDDRNHPVVRFIDSAGKACIVPIWIGGLKLKVGDHVQVIYFPDAPDGARLAEPVSFILPALGFVGAIFVGAMLFADVF